MFETIKICTAVSDYDYDLPKEFIAQCPLENREDARLLVLCRRTGEIEHRKFYEIVDYFSRGDVLIFNNTKVVPACITGCKVSGASVELLFIEDLGENQWKVLIKTGAKLRENEEIWIDNKAIPLKLIKKLKDGSWLVKCHGEIDIKGLFQRIGRMPLPPYIKRAKNNDALLQLDRERYQTVFAQKEGAIAAPTAGLHFSKDTIEKIKDRGVEIGFVTLHVGLGTFLPMKTEDMRDHQIHKEYYECPEVVIQKIEKAKKENKRVVAVGTTSCRVLETIAMSDAALSYSGWTNIFIYPPYKFQNVDILITNFHLPRTTLLLLVSAFAGRENILDAYEIAKRKGYRFFSYGDCMMII